MLAGLSASLEEKITDIKEHIHQFVLGKGLASIPDELLSNILEYAEGSQRRTALKENLSLVCRRFRRLVLNTPRLWSRVSSFDTMRYVRTCLERSKSVGLSINLFIDNKGHLDRGLSFLAEVIPHSSRWEDLNVLFSFARMDLDLRNEIHRSPIFSKLHLSSLYSLSLELSATGNFDFDNDDIWHFYQNWDMPNLRSLDSNLVPKITITSNLCSFRFHRIFGDALRVAHFMKFIAAFPTLQELSIEIYSGYGKAFQQASTIDMPNLRVLHIDASECNRTDVRSFMGALRTPVLHKLSIVTSVPRSEDEDSALYDFFPHDDYPTLKELSIRMHPHPDSPTDFFLPTERFRGLRSLSLDTPGIVPDISYYEDENGQEKIYPPLHSLSIVNWDNMSICWLTEMQESLLRQNDWAGFKRLEIYGALDSSSVREINKVYGGEDKDVVWKERTNKLYL